MHIATTCAIRRTWQVQLITNQTDKLLQIQAGERHTLQLLFDKTRQTNLCKTSFLGLNNLLVMFYSQTTT